MPSKMCLRVNPQQSQDLAHAGFKTYEDFLFPPVGEVVSEVRDRVVLFIGKETLGSETGFYLKIFRNKGANRPFRQLLGGEWPHSCAEVEQRRLSWLADHGFEAPRVVAWGGVVKNGLSETSSFLMTENLEGLQAMDEWLDAASGLLSGREFSQAKRFLLAAIARTLSRLHSKGFHHPYPYLRHFFVPAFVLDSRFREDEESEFGTKGAVQGSSRTDPRVAVIDVHCASIGAPVSMRNRCRGLAELFVSSLKAPVSHTDRVYFLHEYCGGEIDRVLVDRTLRRFRQKLRRHPNRYRWAKEVIGKSRFPTGKEGLPSPSPSQDGRGERSPSPILGEDRLG